VGPPFRSAVVAAPAYLQKHGKPRHPKELCAHRCVNYRYPSGKKFLWAFQKGRSKLEVEIEGVMTFDDPELVLRAAAEGAGIGYVFEAQVIDHMTQGRLERVLEDWCPEMPGFHLYYPSRRNLSNPGLRSNPATAR
jgi:DNA-binding transcriptional LysR family regulator